MVLEMCNCFHAKNRILKCVGICLCCMLGCLFIVGCDEDAGSKEESVKAKNDSVSIVVERDDRPEIGNQQQVVVSIERESKESDTNILDGTDSTENADILDKTDITEDANTLDEAENANEVGALDEEENTDGLNTLQCVPGATESVSLNPMWKYADFAQIKQGSATLYRARENRRNIVVGVNAGHGTKNGQSVKTYCHPDMSPKVTGGTTSAGSVTAVAVSSGMTFLDGTREADVTLRMAQILRDKLLTMGFDVLMIRDSEDVQLDNVARTVICNNVANCHIALHWDGDGLDHDKGCFYISTPDGIKGMEPVSGVWQQHEVLGTKLIEGLKSNGCKIYKNGSMDIDLTQTSFSTIPSVDIELGNAASKHDDGSLSILAGGLVYGISDFYK